MSRVTSSIKRINEQLDRISGLGGIVSEIVEQKEKEIKDMVEFVLRNHKNANAFDFYGDKFNDFWEEED